MFSFRRRIKAGSICYLLFKIVPARCISLTEEAILPPEENSSFIILHCHLFNLFVPSSSFTHFYELLLYSKSCYSWSILLVFIQKKRQGWRKMSKGRWVRFTQWDFCFWILKSWNSIPVLLGTLLSFCLGLFKHGGPVKPWIERSFVNRDKLTYYMEIILNKREFSEVLFL